MQVLIYFLTIEAIAKLLRPRKSPFWRQFSLHSLACPFGHGLVCAARASLLALRTGVKIIDFLGHSSFATASIQPSTRPGCWLNGCNFFVIARQKGRSKLNSNGSRLVRIIQ